MGSCAAQRVHHLVAHNVAHAARRALARLQIEQAGGRLRGRIGCEAHRHCTLEQSAHVYHRRLIARHTGVGDAPGHHGCNAGGTTNIRRTVAIIGVSRAARMQISQSVGSSIS